MFVVYHIYGVPHQAGVTVAGLVEGVQHRFAVRLVLFFLELLGLEEVVPRCGVGLLHVLGKLALLDIRVAGEVDFLDVHLLAAVYGKVHAYGAADYCVLDDLGVHVHVDEAFLLVVALDDVYGGVLHVVGEFAAGPEVEPFLEVFLLSGLDSGICPAGNARALTDYNLEPCGVGLGVEGVYPNLHVLEVSLGHKALHYSGDVVSGDGNFHALPEACELENLVFTEIHVAFYADAAHSKLSGVGVVNVHAFLGMK